MNRFFSFERLIAPAIIKAVYWIGLLVIVVGGLIALFQAIQVRGGLGGFLALVAVAFAILLWRIVCELYIVAFGIYERLGDIRTALVADPRR